jgi:putative membrane protein
MNRTILLAGAAALALTLSACGKKADDTDMAAQAVPDANPTMTVPTPADESAAPDFVAKAAASDMFEIESSKVALERSKNPQVKAFAQMMIDMHTQTTADLKQAIADSGLAITPPATLPDDKASTLSDLKGVDMADFDKKYMDAQVDGHQATLDLMTRYAQDGDNTVLKAAAAKTAPIVQEHLTKAKALRDSIS